MLDHLSGNRRDLLRNLAEVDPLRRQLRGRLKWQQTAESAQQIADLTT